MSLTPFTGTTSASVLDSNCDSATSTLTTNASAGQKDQVFFIFLASMTSATALALRSTAWTQQDDAELRVFMGHATADGTDRTMTVTLTVDNGDATFLVNNTFAIQQDALSTIDTRDVASQGDYRTTSGTRVRLLRGVRYRLTMSVNAGTLVNAEGLVQLRSIRRPI